MVEFLVLGTLTDPHVARVIEWLTQWGVSCEVMDHQNDARCSLRIQDDGRCRLVVNGKDVPPSALVWDRVKLMMMIRKPGEEHAAIRWRIDEWKANYRAVAEIWSANLLNPLFAKGR